jgi:phosphatidate cytidylyltransferase
MLRARVATALLLAVGFLAVLFLLPKPSAGAVFALVAAAAAWEWTGLLKGGAAARAVFAAIVLASCLAFDQRWFAYLWAGSGLFWCLAAPLWLARRWALAAAGPWAGFAIGWLLICATWAAMTGLLARGPWWLLATMAFAWAADIAAYFAGRAWGRRKLAPAISPGKTWEGVAGGAVGVLLYGAFVAWAAGFMPSASTGGFIAAAAFLLLLLALSIVGDLFESLVKRQAGVKDSGRLLPGHGGVLDRIDSQLSTLPIVALALHLWP